MIFKNFYTKKKIFFIGSVFVIGFLLHSNSASAASTYKSLVQIPCVLLSGCPANPDALNYLSNLYSFLISVVGIVAMGAIVIGGARYLTSVGNPSAIEDAKHTIYSAIYGLILALVSWVIISTINPDILVLKNPAMTWTGAGYGSGAGGLKCSVGGLGDGSSANPCRCIDDPTKDIFSSVTAGPVVTGTSINPCSTSVSTATSVITISFSEALDPASVSTSTINTFFPGAPPVTIALASPTVVTITIGTPFLAANSPQEIIITTGVRSAGGVAMNATACSASVGNTPAATTAYDIRFTTDSSFAGSTACNACPYGSANACNQICSDKTLAADGNYHCIVAGVRIGWVAGDPASYTDEQLRAMAVNEGTDASPFIAYDGSHYIFEVEKYTTSLYPIVSYTFDGDYNGDCGSTPLTNIGYHKATATYGIEPPPPPVTSCVNSTTPLALTCSQKFCVEDSQGNKADTTIYYSILSK